MIRNNFKRGMQAIFNRIVVDMAEEAIELDQPAAPIIEEPETALFSPVEILNQMEECLDEISESLEDWEPSNELLDALIPEISKLDEGTSAEISEASYEIQEKHLKAKFLTPFVAKLHSLQADVAAMSNPEDVFKHYLYVAVFQSQLVQILTEATQLLVVKAVKRKADLQKAANASDLDDVWDYDHYAWIPSETGEA
jgi:hypothetical protein